MGERADHDALADALMRLIEDDPGALPALVEHRHRDYAYAIAQRLVRNLRETGIVLGRQKSGRGRVTDRVFDQRLKHNRDRKASRRG